MKKLQYIFLILTAFLLTGPAVAHHEIFWQDNITIPSGTIKNIQYTGDITATQTGEKTLAISPTTTQCQGRPSTEHYIQTVSDYFDHPPCAGDGYVWVSITKDNGNTCDLYLLDGGFEEGLSVIQSTCSFIRTGPLTETNNNIEYRITDGFIIYQ